jgi:hypothetical protein
MGNTLSGSAGGEGGGEAEEEKIITIHKTYGDPPFNIYPSGVSKDKIADVTFKSSEPDVLSITGHTATILKSGIVTVTPTYHMPNGDTTELPHIIVRIAKAPLTVKADDVLDLIQGKPMPTLTYTVTGLVGDDTFTNPAITTTAPDTKATGIYDINIEGGTPSNPSYTITYESGTLVILEPATATASTRKANNADNANNSKPDTKENEAEENPPEEMTDELEEQLSEEEAEQTQPNQQDDESATANKTSNWHTFIIMTTGVLAILLIVLLFLIWKKRNKSDDK